MKRLIIWLAILLPLWVNAQTNGTIQKTSATGTVRGSFGSLGLDTLTRVTGALVDGYILKYHAATNKWYASPDPTGSLYWSRSGTTLSPATSGDNISLTGTIFGKRIDARTGERLLLWNQTDADYWSLDNNIDTLEFSRGFTRKAYMESNGSLNLNGNLSTTDLFIRSAHTLVTGTQYLTVRDSVSGLIERMKTTALPVNAGSNNYVQNQYTGAQTGSFFWIDGYGRIDGTPATYTPSLKIGTNSNIPTQAGISVNLNYTPANVETAHAFADRSDYSIKGMAYNSYDISPTFSGTDVSVVTDHYIGLQFTPTATDTTRIQNVYGLDFHPSFAKVSGTRIAAVNVESVPGTFTNKYALRSTQSDVDVSIAGRSYSGGVNSSGTIVSTYAGTSPIFSNASGTTNVQYMDFYNTGGRFWLGNNNSAGSSLPGSTAYATVLNTVGATALQFGTNGSIRQTISSGGDVTFTGNVSAANLASGTYTPTLTNGTNVSSSTAYTCQYMRVGNVVTVSGRIDVTMTASNTATEISVSLPIVSNFSGTENLGGTGNGVGANAPNGVKIEADTTNDRATYTFDTGGSGGARKISFSFTYQII